MKKVVSRPDFPNSAPARKKKRGKTVFVIFLILAIISVVSISSWSIHLRQLRAEMENYLSDTLSSIEQGTFNIALIDAEDARALAQRLRDTDIVNEIDAQIHFINAVIRGNELFESGRYQAARDEFLQALSYVSGIQSIDTGFIDDMLVKIDGYIGFFALIDHARNLADGFDNEAALVLYEQALSAANSLSFARGRELAVTGIAEMRERIALAKRTEATELLSLGDQFFLDEQYSEALECFNNALEIYQELNDAQGITTTNARIDFAARKLEEQAHQAAQADDAQGDPVTQNDLESNYDHNLAVSFDLKTLIDNQTRRPANQIRMGSTDGRNEGWYNGCGWVAAYNALILLGEPQHPAEIVRYFETSGGTVFGGVFGTYPNAVYEYLKYLGYNADHVLFPQMTLNIDNAVKAARAGILAYAHTSAAHFAAIVYREDLDMFVVYNDNFARARSSSLGLENEVSPGAAIDSIAAFINNTPEILFSFSLITVH
jgi:tetratricopeptide (TPR) repeat protein